MNMEKPKLVIADDEIHILRILELKFTSNGFDVEKAMTGQQAWELISRNFPDVVITDYQMPELTGLDIAEKMYSEQRLRNIPVILLTARGFSLTDDDLSNTNIKELITKPFSPREVLAIVRKVTEMKISSGV